MFIIFVVDQVAFEQNGCFDCKSIAIENESSVYFKLIILMICFFFFLFFSIKISTGLALNTSSLTARRDSFDRNTSAFSPSLDFSSSSVAVAANGNGTASRKWPVNNYGAMASVSPLAPGTPPPTGKYILKFHFMLRSLDISI